MVQDDVFRYGVYGVIVQYTESDSYMFFDHFKFFLCEFSRFQEDLLFNTNLTDIMEW